EIGIQGLAHSRSTPAEASAVRNFRAGGARRRLARPGPGSGPAVHEQGGHMASIETPHELFVHKLGAALTMEETILQMLENLREEASDPKLQKDLQQHYRETEQQVQNLARVFQALGEQPEKQACPAIEGLEKEGKQMIKEVDDSLVDSVILGGVIK